MEHLKIDGLRIAFERRGTGLPLVLVHGFFGDSRVWRSQLAALCDRFTVVAWDGPGCGRSMDPPDAFRMADYADCLARFIEVLGLGRAHVLGLSFGGALAIELYGRHPTVPTSLVLASAYAGWAGSLPAEIVERRLEQTIPDLDLPPDHVVARYIPGLLTDGASPALVAEVAAIMADFHPSGMKTMTHALAEADLRDVLPCIGVPTLLLYGDKDVRSPLSVAKDLRAKIPSSTLVVIPGVGHLSNVEAPERFNAEVRGFLESIPT